MQWMFAAVHADHGRFQWRVVKFGNLQGESTQRSPVKWCSVPALFVAVTCALVACSESTRSSNFTAAADASSAESAWVPSTTTAALPPPAQPRLAADPVQLADDLVADEQAIRDPMASEAGRVAAARRQQVAYRALGRDPELHAVVRPRITPPLLEVYDFNVSANRRFADMVEIEPKDTLPAWRIDPPAPADELLGYYRKAEAATGVGWNYLAAINLVETGFGRIVGTSYAGAHGPMQFEPATFDEYGDGGDIVSPHDSIMAAGRYLAASGFADDRDHAIYQYNNSDEYVQAVSDYAAVLAADHAAFAGYYQWEIYYHTTLGDVLLPIGYSETTPIPVIDYLATHPQ
jgi:hypothetical protein